MEEREEAVIASLLDQDEELRKYYEEHIELEKKLRNFNEKAYLSADEEIEKKRLQKLKLIGKDKIMEILSRHK